MELDLDPLGDSSLFDNRVGYGVVLIAEDRRRVEEQCVVG